MGLVGPNGAGKSTTIRILMAHGPPGSRQRPRPRPLDAGASRRRRSARSASSPRTCACTPTPRSPGTCAWSLRFTPTGTRSTRRRCCSASTLHRGAADQGICRTASVSRPRCCSSSRRRPRLLLLDEPTTGLDPVARHEILAELMDVVRDERRAILFSSHNTQDVEQISDEITFIDRGRIIDSSDKETFLDRWRRLHLECRRASRCPACRAWSRRTTERAPRGGHDEGLHAGPRGRLRAGGRDCPRRCSE